MKKILWPMLAALTIAVGACSSPDSINSPAQPSGSADDVRKMVTNVDFTRDQMTVIDEMFYSNENLRLILPAHQADILESVTGPGYGMMGHHGSDKRRLSVDIDALIYFRQILQANPGLDTSVVAAIRALIISNQALRAEAVKQATDAASLRVTLKGLHDTLITDINALLTPEQLALVQALRAELEARRLALQARMDSLRINAQVRYMTEALALDSVQSDSVRAILTRTLAEMHSLRQQYAGDPEGFRLAVQTLVLATEQQLQTVLGTELWARWLVIRETRYGSSGGCGGGTYGSNGRHDNDGDHHDGDDDHDGGGGKGGKHGGGNNHGGGMMGGMMGGGSGHRP